ncbi:MAG: type IV secretion protein DotA [Alphaproteobacteria bacterium PRO2]|nr:type IV secretion protein DotA [Alphaproteobacteria bacterium PRO2]
MLNVTRKEFIRYAVLPGLRPRLQDLFFSGFHYIPFFIALVYSTVRLLPAGHPYLDSANIGRFGIRHVIAEAANHLVLKTRNMDQIVMFGAVLVGMILVFLQVFLLAASLMFQPVLAGAPMPTNFAGFFVTQNPGQDIAMIMLDLVFGVPNLFNSCVNAQGTCLDAYGGGIVDMAGQSIFIQPSWPYAIHDALHEMFRLYSIGLLVVATLITSYFISTIVMETAQSGTPFGKRFNRLWAPIRIVVAFGLLIPIGYGLNSSQYIVLYAAKFGSGFATNGWILFNQGLTETYIGQTRNLVSQPNVPEIHGVLQFMYSASVCAWLEWLQNQKHIRAYAVRDPLSNPPNLLFADWPASLDGGPPGSGIRASYQQVMTFLRGDQDLVIRFGVEDRSTLNKGYVSPICGELIIPLSDPRPPGMAEPGTEMMQRYYIYIVQELWQTVYTGRFLVAENYASFTALKHVQCKRAGGACPPDGKLPENTFRSRIQDFYRSDVEAALTNGGNGLAGVLGGGGGAIRAQVESATWLITPQLLAKGWAGAGMWYNKVAEINGSLTEAVGAIPSVSRWPSLMEYVYEKKRQNDQHVPVNDRFNPQMADGRPVTPREPYTLPFTAAMWESYNYWQRGGFATTSHTEPTGNIVMDTINLIFGTGGLYSMRKNPDIHPLAQLVGLGRSLVESAALDLFLAGGGAVITPALSNNSRAGAAALTSFLISVSMAILTMGFVLYYIVPFLPFIYFFFAVGGWLKAIFEAMIGAPLWALAHIRIDGNGLAGAAAVNGYFLIFEIFLRPILIIFGLLASISTFAAMVFALNQTWDLVVSNLSGFDVPSEMKGIGASMGQYFRSAVDELFFTAIYAIIVYMMALSSFKLIDLIPANILRWMGQSVATENDARENAAESMVSTSTVGAGQATQALGGQMKDITEKIARGGGGSGGGGG